MPVEPLDFQPQNDWVPGHAPVQAVNSEAILELASDELASDGVRALTRFVAVLALAASAVEAQITLKSPSWNELSEPDRRVLAPLAPDWNNLDAQRKQKWIGLARRYPTLREDEQETVVETISSFYD